MSNPNEGYAFITNAGYEGYAKEMFPASISVGENYHLCTYAKTKELSLIAYVESNGFSCKYLGAQETIDSMTDLSEGPFIVYGDDVHLVIESFNG